MSAQTLQSRAWSCDSLQTGAEACAKFSGVDLAKMDKESLKAMLKEANELLAERPLKQVKKEPGLEAETTRSDAETVPAESQELRAASASPRSGEKSPEETLSPASSSDAETIKMLMAKIEMLEKQARSQKSQGLMTPDAKAVVLPPTAVNSRPAKANPGIEQGGASAGHEEPDDDTIVMPDGVKVLSADALRMRLRRLVEVKPSGKSHVDASVREDFKSGGERREWLEIALLEAIRKHGTARTVHKSVKAEFITRIVIVRERMLSKEQEIHGRWLTQEKMASLGEWSKDAIKKICNFCLKFPQTLVRPWKYDSKVNEFFVEDPHSCTLKRTDLVKQSETTEVDDKVSAEKPDTKDLDGDVVWPSEKDEEPNPEVVGEQVGPELEKFMEVLQNKRRTISDMVALLEGPSVPEPRDEYTRLAKELGGVSDKLDACFRALAHHLTAVKMDYPTGKIDPNNEGFKALCAKIDLDKNNVKGPCAELLSLEATFKSLKKNITVKKGSKPPKRSKGQKEKQKTTKPKKGGKDSKQKKRQGSGASKPAAESEPAADKSKRRKRSSKGNNAA